jgi:hypothetical protein
MAQQPAQSVQHVGIVEAIRISATTWNGTYVREI